MQASNPTRRIGAALLAMASFGAMVGVATVAPTSAAAATVEPFTSSFDQELWGDYLLVGNSQMECIAPGTTDRYDVDDDSDTAEALAPLVDWQYTTECASDAARDDVAGSGSRVPNDDRFMVFTQTDAVTSGIFNSSDATITLPPGSTVARARLFWHGNDIVSSGLGGGDTSTMNGVDDVDASPGASPWPSCKADVTLRDWTAYGTSSGDATSSVIRRRLRAAYRAAGDGSRSQMKLRVGGGSYQTITSADEDLSPTDGTSGHLYQQEADVTALLDAAPRNTPVTLTGANISTGEGFGCTGAWALAIVYDYPARDATYAPDLRRVQLYDGFAEVSSTETVTTTLGGFLAAGGGTVEPRAGVVAYEGDQQIIGDSLDLEGTTISEPRLSNHQTDDFWASTVGEFTSSTTADFTRNPNHADAAGPDIKVVPINVGDLASAGDGLTVTFSTSGDRYTPGVFVFSALDSIVTGHVYVDDNSNGHYDAGETGVSGVSLSLSGTSASSAVVNVTATTDADGLYVFPSVPTADGAGYTLTETQPTAYLDGGDQLGTADGADGTHAGSDSFTGIGHSVNAQSTGYDFAEVVPAPAATIVTTVVAGHDHNQCGSGTDPIAANEGDLITFCYLVTNTGNTHLAGSDPPITDPTISGTPVACSCTDLAPSASHTWWAYATAPAHSHTSTATYTSNPVDGGGGDLTGQTDVSVSDAATVNVPGNVDIGDKVFVDLDADGVQDGGEPGLAGVTVTLYDAAGTAPIATDVYGNALSPITTAGNGAYQFHAIAPGTYTVKFAPPGGYVATVTDAGAANEATDSDGLAAQTPALSADTSYANLDAGFVQRGSVAGTVFDDLDADGVFDGFESGLTGVTVTLTGTDLYGNPLTSSQSSTTGGVFSFTNVLPGTYTLTETQPAAYGNGSAAAGTAGGSAGSANVVSGITLASGTAGTGYRFADVPGNLAGVVFDDLDGDGVLDGGEPGIAGVTVALSGTATASATTASDGTYYFADLAPGTYTITETQPSGYVDGIDTAGAAGGSTAVDDVTSAITLSAGQIAGGYWFAEHHVGQISGTVFEDQDGDGVQDGGEPGISGVTVDLGGTATGSTTTGSNGTYQFAGLGDGTYSVTEHQPASHGDGIDTVGAAGGSAAVNDVVSGIVISGSTAATGYLFADVPGSLAGVVFDDTNGNGVKDGGEPGISGVTVALGGTETASTTTAGNGSYSFPNLSAGTYAVTETQPGGYADGIDTAGGAGGSTAVNDVVSAVALGAGVNTTGYLFAEYTAGSIAGTVYEDRNANGVKDGGEPAIAGVTITRSGTSSGSTVTASDGTWSFGGLAPGTYAVTETQPTGYADLAAHVGSGSGSAGTNTITGVTVASGAALTAYDFTEDAGSIAGTVFADGNGNGASDGGDAGIPGVTVTLTGPGGPYTAVTDGSGVYSFGGLLAGSYTITETQPGGWADWIDTAGTSAGTPTEPDAITSISLTAGTDATGYLFAEVTGHPFAGVVYEDADGDGVLDGGEVGLPAVTIILDGLDARGATVHTTTSTDSTGIYSFTVVPGTYSVSETQPGTYVDWRDTAGNRGGTVTEPDTITGVVLTGAQFASGYLFGEVPSASLTGHVTAAEGNGIAGVTIALTGTDLRANPVSRTATSGSDGAYSFQLLPPGTYSVAETQPAGYADGSESVGTGGGTSTTNDVIDGAVLAIGEHHSGYDFFEYRPDLRGRVFQDVDGDGIQATCVGCDPGVADATVQLLDGDGNAVAQTQSLSDGTYAFADVPAGTYVVHVTPPPGYRFTGQDAGTDDARDSDVDLGSGLTDPIALTADVTGVDAGLRLIPVDLSVAVSQSNAKPKQGDPLTYSLTVKNEGTEAAAGPISVNQQLPPGVSPVSATGDRWVCAIAGSTVSCLRTDPLAAGESTPPITVATTVTDASGDLRTVVGVSSPAGDANSSNDQAVAIASPSGSSTLAVTGFDLLRVLLIAGGVLLLGVYLTRWEKKHSPG